MHRFLVDARTLDVVSNPRIQRGAGSNEDLLFAHFCHALKKRSYRRIDDSAKIFVRLREGGQLVVDNSRSTGLYHLLFLAGIRTGIPIRVYALQGHWSELSHFAVKGKNS